MNEDKIKELRAHAGKLVAEGKPLSWEFEYFALEHWHKWGAENTVPLFEQGEWRIAEPKKQLIDWLHPYLKGCATNYGEVFDIKEGLRYGKVVCAHGSPSDNLLRLATPANYDSNWQYFRSTPENDAKLRELAKMVNVEVRVWDHEGSYFKNLRFGRDLFIFESICNYRITGLQDGWTDNPEEAKS